MLEQEKWFTLLTALIAVVTIALWRLQSTREEAAIEYTVPIPDPCRRDWAGELEDLDVPSIQTPGSSLIQCYCPANGKLLGRVNPATPDGIDRAMVKAAEAQVQWARTTFAQRRKVLRTMLKYILDHQDEIVRAACLDSGKTRVDAALGEILVTAEKLAWTIKHGEAALRPERRPTNLLMLYKRSEVRWEPLGVVGACVSWNYPVMPFSFHNLLNPIISALFTGNAAVVKSSEQTAWSAPYFASIARGALSACGHSPALVQSLTCWPAAAAHLTSHPLLAHLTFIGSRPVAHAVAASAARALTPLCAELGGKDAAIVLDDAASFPAVASVLMRGVFQSAGQNCIGIERVVATPRAYAALLTLLTPRVRALRVGDALADPVPSQQGQQQHHVDVGACISDAGFARLERLIADAVASGASLLAGGARLTHPLHPRGHYFTPTLLAGVTREMAIAREELFAPVLVLMRAADVSDSIAVANAAPFGLGASVFGRDAAALARVTAEVHAGMVAVNDFAAYYMVSLPFGGVRGSGYGRFGGKEGLRALCNTKSVCVDRWPGWIGTSIPPRLDYKTEGRQGEGDAEAKAWRFAKGIVETGYGIGVVEKVGGLRNIIANI